MDEKHLLALEGVTVYYEKMKALDGIDLFVDEGEMVALMGPNGAGKSTILKAIFGLVPMKEGRVLWQGMEIRPLPHEVVRWGLSLVPQGRRVFSHLSVQENLEMGAFTLTGKAEIERRMEEVTQLFPILGRKRALVAGSLSGGEQQMLAIGRGLMSNPHLLLLDEPSLGLAPLVVADLFVKIREINQIRGTAVVLVEHSIKSALDLVDRGYVLDKGKVLASGTPSQLMGSATLQRAFLGH